MAGNTAATDSNDDVDYNSLGPRPSTYVRVLICGGGNNGVIPSPANQNAHNVGPGPRLTPGANPTTRKWLNRNHAHERNIIIARKRKHDSLRLL